MNKNDFPFTNRELSWLEFNKRILERAQDSKLPLLERLKFLSIFSSNLDEFFMVRVGGLQMLAEKSNRPTDPSNLTPEQQLDFISKRVHEMTGLLYNCYLNDLEISLATSGIRRIRTLELTEEQRRSAESVFVNDIFPILSPVAVTPPLPIPLLSNRSIHFAVRLKGEQPEPDSPRYAFITISKNISRFITLPSSSGYQFMLIEDLVNIFVNRYFPGESISECVPFRIIRNADLMIREDSAFDLMAEMEAVIDARKRSDFVRLEIGSGASRIMLDFLKKSFDLKERDIYKIDGPLDFSSFFKLNELQGFPELKNEPWQPQPSPIFEPGEKIFDLLVRRDVLLCHPYESFEPVVRLIDEAANDPNVAAIKQTLYRTSRDSPIVAALMRAAVKGKYVTVIVELKARFDEERNIEWAKELEDAGVQVLYGVKGLKTHAKVCLIIRREPQGLVKYMHFGTGNYNEITAHLYSDISYMTCDGELGADTSAFFNSITGYSQPPRFRKLEAAPIGLREKLIGLIDNERERKLQGQKAFIKAKMNSLADPRIIKALYDASKAGVQIQLNVRGICCLCPGIPGISDNITVVSIVDRFLEHARIFHFHHGGEDKVFISTADWMPRNLDRRIELLIPVNDSYCAKRLIDILDVFFRDNAGSWKLQPDGRCLRIKSSVKKKLFRAQDYLYRSACATYQKNQDARRTVFEPYRPQ